MKDVEDNRVYYFEQYFLSDEVSTSFTIILRDFLPKILQSWHFSVNEDVFMKVNDWTKILLQNLGEV